MLALRPRSSQRALSIPQSLCYAAIAQVLRSVVIATGGVVVKGYGFVSSGAGTVTLLTAEYIPYQCNGTKGPAESIGRLGNGIDVSMYYPHALFSGSINYQQPPRPEAFAACKRNDIEPTAQGSCT